MHNMDQDSQADSLNEVRILSSLDNIYIVKYFDSFVEDSKLHIIMEFCEKGDVSNLIKSRTQLFKENKIWEIFLQICLGLEYLHSKKTLHRDIKTLNIFLFSDKSIRIGDLGVARVLSSTTTFAHTVIGTPYYLSPELCEEKPYNLKSDVWALGCVLHELCSLKKPFDATNAGALILKILRSNYPPINPSFSSELKEIVRLCLLKDQRKRPEIPAILRRPGIKERILSLNLPVPETSVLYTAKVVLHRSVEEVEEEKSVSVPVSAVPAAKKMLKTQESKSSYKKPRVRKGAPLNSKKSGYSRNPPVRLPKPVQKAVITEEAWSVANLPDFKAVTAKELEDEASIVEECNYEIVTTDPPPLPELKFNTVQQFGITSDSSSDDEVYNSDDRELFNIQEVDDRLEHTNQTLKFKLQEIERSEKEFERIIEQRRNEIINKIGASCYEELYGYFKEKFIVRDT